MNCTSLSRETILTPSGGRPRTRSDCVTGENQEDNRGRLSDGCRVPDLRGISRDGLRGSTPERTKAYPSDTCHDVNLS